MRIFLDLLVVGMALAGGSYVYWRAEQILDRIIEFQKRVRGGYYHKEKTNPRCPSCGHKNGEIFYNHEVQRLMHHCLVCQAVWPARTRIPVEAWDYYGKVMKEDQDRVVDV